MSNLVWNLEVVNTDINNIPSYRQYATESIEKINGSSFFRGVIEHNIKDSTLVLKISVLNINRELNLSPMLFTLDDSQTLDIQLLINYCSKLISSLILDSMKKYISIEDVSRD